MKTQSHPYKTRLMTRFMGAFFALACLPAFAYIIDNFNGAKTGWTDTLNGGSATVANGYFTLTTATTNGALTSSRKTATNYTLVVGNSLEFRVGITNNTTPGGGDTNALSILAWVPGGGGVMTNGYSLAFGANDFQIRAGTTVLFATNAFSPSSGISRNTNVTMCLRLTPAGDSGSVSVNARVYKRDDPTTGDTPPNNTNTVIFEWTSTDPSGAQIGVAGNVAVGALNQASGSGVSVSFDDLSVFDMINSVLDNFNVNNGLAGWTTFTNPINGASGTHGKVYWTNNTVRCEAAIASAGGFSGLYYNSSTIKVVDGGQVTFQADLVDNGAGNTPASYSVLGYLPDASRLTTLQEYFITHDYVNTTVLLTGKRLGVYSSAGNNSYPYPMQNVRYTLNMLGEGLNCRVECRLEDLSKAVNDPARVIFQSVFIDTPGADIANEAATGLQAPYLNRDGSFTVSVFNAGNVNVYAVFDNATISQTLPPPAAPIINNLNLLDSANLNFISPTNVISFDVTHAINIATDHVSVTLNGVLYTNGHPNFIMTPTFTPSSARHIVITNVLGTNVNYVGTCQADDGLGNVVTRPLFFDTFLTNNYVVECEEYNFNSGQFIDNPEILPEGGVDNCCAYNGQLGWPGIDFHDNRCNATCEMQPPPSGPGYDANHTFRTDDAVYTTENNDTTRAKYLALGGPTSNFFEEELNDIRDGDWVNYTHHYPAGTYLVYLRQSQYAIAQSLVTLDLVTSDPTTNNQTVTTLGSFLGSASGLGTFHNVPLTDGVGNPIVLRFDGTLKTLRLSEVTTGNASATTGVLEQNYLIFVPITVGTLRPIVSAASPLPNQVISAQAPATQATIANRDTKVDTNTIVLRMNGTQVPVTIVSNAAGALVSWCLSVVPAARTITNTLTFQDNLHDVTLSNVWSYSYPFLAASNSLPLGARTVPGFNIHTVWNQNSANGGATLGNSLARAEGQLGYPPTPTPEPGDINATNVTQELYWNNDTACPIDVPGLTGVCGAPVPVDNIATESQGYMQLTAGAHRFHAVSDDGFSLKSSTSPSDHGGTVMGIEDGGTANEFFDFVVEAAGLYPIRNVWYENGGNAYYFLTSVDPCTGAETIVNDPGNPAGVVKVFTTTGISLFSSTSASGPYTMENSAVIDPVGKTATVAISATAKFYRLNAPSSTTLTKISKVGSNIVINYQ